MTVNVDNPKSKLQIIAKRHLWWMAPICIIIPLSILSGDPVNPTIAYIGTTGIWTFLERLADLG